MPHSLIARAAVCVRNRSSEGADDPAHTDTDTEMGYRDKSKGMYMDEILEKAWVMLSRERSSERVRKVTKLL